MTAKVAPVGRDDIEALVLRALVRKLVLNGLLSPEDVRALLFDAVRSLDAFGGILTPEAARRVVEEDLAPAFLPT
jgi:hypothetical protein